jgi:hypothetical protein
MVDGTMPMFPETKTVPLWMVACEKRGDLSPLSDVTTCLGIVTETVTTAAGKGRRAPESETLLTKIYCLLSGRRHALSTLVRTLRPLRCDDGEGRGQEWAPRYGKRTNPARQPCRIIQHDKITASQNFDSPCRVLHAFCQVVPFTTCPLPSSSPSSSPPPTRSNMHKTKLVELSSSPPPQVCISKLSLPLPIPPFLFLLSLSCSICPKFSLSS